MRSLAEVVAWANRRWRRNWPDWLAAWPHAGSGVVAELGLNVPTEQQMAADPEQVARWVGQWQAAAAAGQVQLEWANRSWRAYGRQRLPVRVGLTVGQLAALVGQEATWQRARGAVEQLRSAWGEVELDEAIARTARLLGVLDEADLLRLMSVLGWLAAHPASGLWERELPIPDVDTKWFENHRGLVATFAEAVSGTTQTGLRRHGKLFRLNLLQEGSDGSPSQFGVDLDELRALELKPRRVLICENATTVAVLPRLPDTVAIHGQGFAASTLAEVGWIATAEQWYWGDLDSYGFAILSRVRAVLPGVRSILMDAQTFTDNKLMSVPEPVPYAGEIGHLTLGELDALAAVRAGNWRLEQERIPREYARSELLRALT